MADAQQQEDTPLMPDQVFPPQEQDEDAVESADTAEEGDSDTTEGDSSEEGSAGDKDKKAKKEKRKVRKLEPMVLRERYDIDIRTPMPELDTAYARAYGAADRRDPGRVLFALLHESHLPPRLDVARSLKGVQAPALMTLIEYGVILKEDGTKGLVFIYVRPSGGKVIDRIAEKPYQADHLFIRRVITPFLHTLKELGSRGISHRSLRLSNLYYADDRRERILLGDCVTGPAAHMQPAVYETVPSMMSIASGRGQGETADDLYALAVTLVALCIGRDPCHNIPTERILQRKMMQGSYAGVVQEQRLPLQMVELLRGLLCDDALERWQLEQLELWVNGRRLSPLQPSQDRRAQRGIRFKGVEFQTARSLAHAMHYNWEAALPMLVDGTLEAWLRRGLEDKEKADGVQRALAIGNVLTPDPVKGKDLAMVYAIMVMDPDGPIRYRDLAVKLDGFGALLVDMLHKGQDVQPLADLMSKDIPKYWVMLQQGGYHPDHRQWETRFAEIRVFMRQNGLGMGVERALYELNNHYPCQSAYIANEYVIEIRDLLPALDRAAKNADGKHWPMDRHLAAFIGAHIGEEIAERLDYLNDSDKVVQMVGILGVLATLQWRLGPESLHGLAGWVGGLVAPIINSYESRERRRKIEKELPRLVRKGSLPEIFNLLENFEERRRDKEEFAMAQAEFDRKSKEIRELESGKVGRDENASKLGKQIASGLAVLLATLTYVLMITLQFM